MNCLEFKEKYKNYMTFPLDKKICESEEHKDFTEHMFDCRACRNWDLEKRVEKRGYRIEDFPCVHIAYHVTETCPDHSDAWECPDIAIVNTNHGYGIPIRDGGRSMLKVEYCPWCGKKLNKHVPCQAD